VFNIVIALLLFFFVADSDREKSSASGTSTPVSSEYVEEKIEKPPIPQEERDRKIGRD
jgi:hypothetical protein